MTPMSGHKDRVDGPIPARAGIGLKTEHASEILETKPDIGWFEGHAENYMVDGGPVHRMLEAVRRDYPLSLHGVGLSLGASELPDAEHLKRLAALIDRYQPGLVSEHASWCGLGGAYFNDLLPIPYTEESLDILCRNVAHTQEVLRRKILVENPSTYVAFAESMIPEVEFLSALAQRTGCGLLLDINNIYVCSRNHGFNPCDYLGAVPFNEVGEIHLAGHVVEQVDGAELLIDNHGDHVDGAVWALLETFAPQLVGTPVLVEWDANIPTLDVWLSEAAKAEQVMAQTEAVNEARHAVAL